MGNLIRLALPGKFDGYALVGDWTASVASELAALTEPHLVLNYALGWKGTHLDFLKDCPPLHGLTVIDWRLKDVAGVRHQTHLKQLDLKTYSQSPINFQPFSCLERLFVCWHENLKGLFDCRSLRDLSISNLTHANLAAMNGLRGLQRLWIVKGRLESLSGIAGCSSMKECTFGNLSKLTDISALGECVNTLRVDFRSCKKVFDFGCLGQLKMCEDLRIWDCGSIKDLDFLLTMKNVVNLDLAGNNEVASCDLAPILSLSKLKEFKMKPRTGYVPSLSEIKVSLNNRSERGHPDL